MDFVEMEPNAQVTMSLISVRQQAQQNEPISIRDVIQWVIKNKLSQRPLDFLN